MNTCSSYAISISSNHATAHHLRNELLRKRTPLFAEHKLGVIRLQSFRKSPAEKTETGFQQHLIQSLAEEAKVAEEVHRSQQEIGHKCRCRRELERKARHQYEELQEQAAIVAKDKFAFRKMQEDLRKAGVTTTSGVKQVLQKCLRGQSRPACQSRPASLPKIGTNASQKEVQIDVFTTNVANIMKDMMNGAIDTKPSTLDSKAKQKLRSKRAPMRTLRTRASKAA